MPDGTLSILLIEDSPTDADLVQEFLADSAPDFCRVTHAKTLAEGIRHADSQAFDVVLLDLGLPDALGLPALKHLIGHVGAAAVIVLTGTDDRDIALAALRSGAQDYLVKNETNADSLVRAVRYASERQRLRHLAQERGEQLSLLLESLPIVIYAGTLAGSFPPTYVSANLPMLLGWTPGQFIGTPSFWADQIHPDDRAGALAERTQVFDRQHNESEYRWRHADGGYRWLFDAVRRIDAPDGQPSHLVGVLMDITRRKQAEEASRLAKQSLEATVEARTCELKAANDQLKAWAEVLEQRHHDMLLLSEMTTQLQGTSDLDQACQVIARFVGTVFAGDSGAFYLANEGEAGDGTTGLTAMTAWGDTLPDDPLRLTDGCRVLVSRHTQTFRPDRHDEAARCAGMPDREHACFCVPMMAQDKVLGILRLIVAPEAARDIMALERKELLAKSACDRIGLALANIRLQCDLRNLSIRDPLTGLFNRRHMEDALEHELAQAERHGTPLAVVMMDIDHFKQFNDTFGHDGGDALLRAMGDLLRGHVRGGDIACRYGGEEMLLILPNTPPEVARRRAEELRLAVKALSVVDQGCRLDRVTVSFGVAVYPADGTTADAVQRAADAALYRAKRSGRDRVCAAWEA